MNNGLENYYKELTEKISEFEKLKEHEIRLEKHIRGGNVAPAKFFKEPFNWGFQLGFYFGIPITITPFLIIFIIIFKLTPIQAIIIIAFIFLLYSICHARSDYNRYRKAKSDLDFDFLIRSSKESLPHELAHIYLQGEKMKELSYKGFRNGLKHCFNLIKLGYPR